MYHKLNYKQLITIRSKNYTRIDEDTDKFEVYYIAERWFLKKKKTVLSLTLKNCLSSVIICHTMMVKMLLRGPFLFNSLHVIFLTYRYLMLQQFDFYIHIIDPLNLFYFLLWVGCIAAELQKWDCALVLTMINRHLNCSVHSNVIIALPGCIHTDSKKAINPIKWVI